MPKRTVQGKGLSFSEILNKSRKKLDELKMISTFGEVEITIRPLKTSVRPGNSQGSPISSPLRRRLPSSKSASALPCTAAPSHHALLYTVSLYSISLSGFGRGVQKQERKRNLLFRIY